MATLSYDLHLHPGDSTERWGDGDRVWRAARAAGVRGFVWKDHDRHTAMLAGALPCTPVRAIGSASLNPWSDLQDVVTAIEEGALWVWGPTQTGDGGIGWDLPLPDYWPVLADWIRERGRPLVLATGHADAVSRAALAAVARDRDHLICSITHTLFVPIEELLALVAEGCVFEIDAYTLATEIGGRSRGDVATTVRALADEGACVYLTSDGGQAATGNPFEFASRVVDCLKERLDARVLHEIAVENPSRLAERVGA